MMKRAIRNTIGSIAILFFLLSCEDPVIPNIKDVFKYSQGTYLYNVDMGIKQQKILRDDQQNLILILAGERLPLYREIFPGFSVTPNSKIWPMDPRYFDGFQAANPDLDIHEESFIFPEISGDLLIQDLVYAINTGIKVNFIPMTKTIISSAAERYLAGGAYNYIVMSESGKVRNWRIKIIDPDKEKASLVEASFPQYLNPKLPRNVYATIDQDQAIVSWVVPYGVALSSLVPYLVASSDRPILLDGKTYIEGAAVDFSAINTLRVSSPSGIVTKDYQVNIIQAPSDNALFAFVVPTIGNPGLSRNITLIFTSATGLEARVPYGTVLSGLKGWASISPGARSSFGGREFVNGETVQDFGGGPITLRVSNSDNSRSRDYTLLITEDRSGAKLLDLTLGINPGLQQDGDVYLSQKRADVFIYQNWDFATDGPLSLPYRISPGATATLDRRSLAAGDTGLLALSSDLVEMAVSSNDGTVTNIYQIQLSMIDTSLGVKMLSFNALEKENPKLLDSFHTVPQADNTVRGRLLSPSLDALVADILLTPGATARWEDGSLYDKNKAVDFRKPRTLRVLSPDGSSEYPYTITLSNWLPNPIYVKTLPDKSEGNGSTWDESVQLHEAINMVNLFATYPAFSGTTFAIWMEEGVYIPPTGTVPYSYVDPSGNARATTITRYYKIPPKVAIYGGFVGTEDRLSQRVLKPSALNPTVISADPYGDDNGNNNRDENLGVLFAGRNIEDVTIDGLVFRGISRISTTGNSTAGIDFSGASGSQLTFSNNRIENSDTFFLIDKIPTVTVKDNQFVDSRGAGEGARIRDGKEVKVEDNLFQNNDTYLNISGASSDLKVTGNTIRDVGPGLVLNLKKSTVLLKDNFFEDTRGAHALHTSCSGICGNNFTMKNNTFRNTGAGLYAVGSEGYTLRNNLFENNVQAINIAVSKKTILTDNEFKNNGKLGKSLLAVRIQTGNATVANNLFETNRGETIFRLMAERKILTNNTFQNNQVDSEILWLENVPKQSTETTLKKNEFRYNQGITGAGAVFLSSDNVILIDENIFENNQGGKAGALALDFGQGHNSAITLTNNIFRNNQSVKHSVPPLDTFGSGSYGSHGGAIYTKVFYDRSTKSTSWPVWLSSGNTFEGNSAEDAGISRTEIYYEIRQLSDPKSIDPMRLLSASEVNTIFNSAAGNSLYSPQGSDTFSGNSSPEISHGDYTRGEFLLP